VLFLITKSSLTPLLSNYSLIDFARSPSAIFGEGP